MEAARRGWRVLVWLLYASSPHLLGATQDPLTLAAGVWNNDLWFIPASVLIVIGLIPVVSRINERFLFGRHRALETAVRARTEELDKERLRERSFNQVLLTLVSSRALGEVLDGIASLVGDQFAGVQAAILIREAGTESGWKVVPVIIAMSAMSMMVFEPCVCSVTPRPWKAIAFSAFA